jgi:hypothetical protein
MERQNSKLQAPNNSALDTSIRTAYTNTMEKSRSTFVKSRSGSFEKNNPLEKSVTNSLEKSVSFKQDELLDQRYSDPRFKHGDTDESIDFIQQEDSAEMELAKSRKFLRQKTEYMEDLPSGCMISRQESQCWSDGVSQCGVVHQTEHVYAPDAYAKSGRIYEGSYEQRNFGPHGFSLDAYDLAVFDYKSQQLILMKNPSAKQNPFAIQDDVSTDASTIMAI